MATPSDRTAPGAFLEARRRLLDDRSLRGRSFCRAYSDLADGWLAGLLDETGPAGRSVALVAIGGYGRRELAPGSDLDVMLLHGGERGVGELAERLWYPVWDAGVKLGHAVRTAKEALSLAADDLDTATCLLDARFLAGEQALVDDLRARATSEWRKRSSRWLGRLAESVRSRHQRFGEVAFLLEPDLKEGRGGLRDVHALRWAEAAERVLFPRDDAALDEAYAALLDARVALHRRTGRAIDRLLLEEQDAVAADLGDADADVLMARVAAAARVVAWTGDDTWRRVQSALAGPKGRGASRDRPAGPGVLLRDGEVHIDPGADVAADPVLALRAASVAAAHATRIARPSLERLAAGAQPLPDPWPAEALDLFVRLLRAGHDAVPVLESLDQVGLLTRVLPEWEPVRSRPQRNAYHRFTVDRHLLEAAAEAAALDDRVARPDLLVVGALLHDLGKGYPGDHTEAGMELVERIGPRMGLPPGDVAVLVDLVRLHLLLPDVAVRRDLTDPRVVERVASEVGSVATLELLAALTEADSIATGSAAWGPWKRGLVTDLVGRARHLLEGGALGDLEPRSFPTARHRDLMADGGPFVEGQGDTLTVVAPDRPGLFSRVAGALTMGGLDVLGADAHSTDDGMAVEVFRVAGSLDHEPDWPRVVDAVRRAVAGRLAVDAGVRERARTYGSRAPTAPSPVVPSVLVDNDSSASATVLEVRTPDAVGVLYRITRALAELDLDIRHAKVQTLGHEVVDSFYVRDAAGAKVEDPDHLREIERAVLAAVSG